MARIRIYIARHLCTAPRPQKEADALAAAGHEVSVHGVAYRSDYSSRDATIVADRAWRWEPAADFTRWWSAPTWALARLNHRLAKTRYARDGSITTNVWSYANTHLMRHALFKPADLTLVHSEGTLWFSRELRRIGCRVGVDFEDWFSEDLNPSQRRSRPVALLAELEKESLHATPYAIAPSHSMATAMGETFGAPSPSVIYNTFPEVAPTPPPRPAPERRVRLHWFSLTLGPDRGLESLFSSLALLEGDWELHLRGEVSLRYKHLLLGLAPHSLHVRIYFHPTVGSSALPSLIAENDIGLALDVSTIRNRNLTVTNKLFQYLQAGLAILASDTEGHREILSQAPGCGFVFTSDNPANIAGLLNRWLNDRALLHAARVAAREAYVRHFSHENQRHLYAELAARALSA